MLTRVEAFRGEAEVQGVLRRVVFEDERLSIEGLRLEDAYAILDVLSVRVLTGVNPLGRKASEPAAGKLEAVPAAPAPAVRESRAERKESKVQAAPAPREEAPREAVQETPLTEPGEVPEHIATSKRFIEVMDWVMKTRGLAPTQVDEIVAACEAFKHLPVVARVRDLKDKVASNLAAYAEAGNAA